MDSGELSTDDSAPSGHDRHAPPPRGEGNRTAGRAYGLIITMQMIIVAAFQTAALGQYLNGPSGQGVPPPGMTFYPLPPNGYGPPVLAQDTAAPAAAPAQPSGPPPTPTPKPEEKKAEKEEKEKKEGEKSDEAEKKDEATTTPQRWNFHAQTTVVRRATPVFPPSIPAPTA